MSLATLIAGIAIVLDSQILVIGAMVLGPEFGAIAALGVALVRRRPLLFAVAARALAIGFAVAIAVTGLAALAGRAFGWVDARRHHRTSSGDRLHLRAGQVVLHRRDPRRGCRSALPDVGPARWPERSLHLRDDDSRCRQRGARSRLRCVARGPGQRRAARRQHRRHGPGGLGHARAAAGRVVARAGSADHGARWALGGRATTGVTTRPGPRCRPRRDLLERGRSFGACSTSRRPASTSRSPSSSSAWRSSSAAPSSPSRRRCGRDEPGHPRQPTARSVRPHRLGAPGIAANVPDPTARFAA